MNKRLQKMLARRTEVLSAMTAMLDAAEAATSGAVVVLTIEDEAKYKALQTELTALDGSIEREKALIEAMRLGPTVTDMHVRGTDEPFRSLGENLQAIAKAMSPGRAFPGAGEVDPRLYGAQSFPTGASANVGPDGGFFVKKDFAIELVSKGEKAGTLSSRCSTTPIGEGSDSLEVVTIDEYDRGTGSQWGGVQVYRRSEADTVAVKQPKFGKWESRLEDMMGLAVATERLLQDATALGNVFRESFTDVFGFKLDGEIMAGTGAGQCYGLTGHPATIAVPKETGQTAKTIVFENVANMWARVPYKHRARGAWFYNIETEPQLQTLQIGTGTSATLVFLPPTGIRGNVDFATIYGRPAFPIEQAEALGSVGDLSFFDLGEYKLITKGDVQSDESIHVRFVYAERTFRWIVRVNGAPKWKTVLTPYKGTNKLSPFVQIAAR